MMTFTDKHNQVISEYTRAIVHMRSQLKESKNRFGLVFGAGLSRSFGLPDWEKLVFDIASDEEIDISHLIKKDAPNKSLSYKTEMIYQHFKKQKLSEADKNSKTNIRELEYKIANQWLRILRENLYKDYKGDIEKEISKHPYFGKLIPIIQKTQMTVTYNFDDFIEKALFAKRGDEEKKETRGYEVVTTPWTQFRRDNAVIYHPNGIVPYEKMEVPSDKIIFSESAFADQILAHSSGEDSGLLNHLSKNTCLFLGLSLEDETVRGLLSKSARYNPGSVHYYVMYLNNGQTISPEHRHAICHANFQVYNLITLFLDNDGIAALLDLINCDKMEFIDLADQVNMPICYRFYLTGPLGVGKSTTINHLRNLLTFDEWLEPRKEILAKPWRSLKAGEKNDADNWVIEQWSLKNTRLRHKGTEGGGIFVIDRGPMDPIVFTAKEERSEKAKKLLEAYSPGKSSAEAIPGKLLLLTGNAKELEIRLKLSDRNKYTEKDLKEMTENLKEVYGKDNIQELDTTGMSIAQMIKRISEIIHLDKYKEMNMQQRLTEVSLNGQEAK